MKETNEYVGRITLGHGNRAGQSEIEYILNRKFWDKGFGTEAISSIVLHLVPKLVEREFLLESRPLDSVAATVREDNPGSWKILEKIGFECKGIVEKFGVSRRSYFCNVNQLCLDVYYRDTFQCLPPKFSGYTFFRTEVCGASEPEHIQAQWDNI